MFFCEFITWFPQTVNFRFYCEEVYVALFVHFYDADTGTGLKDKRNNTCRTYSEVFTAPFDCAKNVLI